MTTARPVFAVLLVGSVASCHSADRPKTDCDDSIKLPAGFCAKVLADTVGKARHLAVRSNGDVFVARLSSRHDSGGISVIRGDSVVRFGNSATHGLALASDSTLYASTEHEILRYRFNVKDLAPLKRVDTIVTGLPSGPIASHSVALDGHGGILVNVSALSVGCQKRNPCPDLATSGGIWRFDTGKRNQTIKDGTHVVSGLRDAIALAVNPTDSMLYTVSHGEDSLHERFPQIDAFVAATHPGDEMDRVAGTHADFGWPNCYFDVIAGKRVQSPEYGGDGKTTGDCDRVIRPLMAFPAHWAPMALVFTDGAKLPAKYQGGAFVGFHGSADRAPLQEDGYVVVYLPFKEGMPTMDFETFADGFAGPDKTPLGARHRVAGLALGADGSLYVSDDKGGRIWKISYQGK